MRGHKSAYTYGLSRKDFFQNISRWLRGKRLKEGVQDLFKSGRYFFSKLLNSFHEQVGSFKTVNGILFNVTQLCQMFSYNAHC